MNSSVAMKSTIRSTRMKRDKFKSEVANIDERNKKISGKNLEVKQLSMVEEKKSGDELGGMTNFTSDLPVLSKDNSV